MEMIGKLLLVLVSLCVIMWFVLTILLSIGKYSWEEAAKISVLITLLLVICALVGGLAIRFMPIILKCGMNLVIS